MLLGIPIISDFLTKSIHVCRTHLYDVYDRLHFLLTAYILAFFVILIGAKQHFGNPIDCMLPKEVDDITSWKNYVHTFCLIHGTYRYTFNASSINNYGQGYTAETTVPYYQWVPFFLAFQIFCFIFPHWAWTWMQKLLYLDMAMVVGITKDLINEKNPGDHKSKLEKTISYTYDHFKYRRLHRIGYFHCIFMHPAFACVLYIFTKLMFLGNAILQLKFVSMFLGFDSWTWGFEMVAYTFSSRNTPVLHNIQENENPAHLDTRPRYGNSLAFEEFNHFKNFPILVACDYNTLPTLNHLVTNTAQCIIPLNIINEKVFVGLWIWFVVLIGLTVIGTVRWIARLTSRRGNEMMIFNLLKSADRRKTTKILNKTPDFRYEFVHKFLGSDGILMIYFMQDKCGVIQTQEVVNGLYRRFVKENTGDDKPAGGKSDFSEVNFGANFDEDELYYRRRV